MDPQKLSDVDFYRDLGPLSRQLAGGFGIKGTKNKQSKTYNIVEKNKQLQKKAFEMHADVEKNTINDEMFFLSGLNGTMPILKLEQYLENAANFTVNAGRQSVVGE